MSRSYALPALLGLALVAAVVLGPLEGAPAPEQVETDLFGVTLVNQAGGNGKSQPGQPGQPGNGSGTFEITSGVAGLYPGATSVIVLKIENYSQGAIRITELAARVRSVTTPCVASQLVLGADGTGVVSRPTANHPAPGSTQPLVVAKGGTGFYAFPVAMQALQGTRDDRCQKATWSLDYTGTAVKA